MKAFGMICGFAFLMLLIAIAPSLMVVSFIVVGIVTGSIKGGPKRRR